MMRNSSPRPSAVDRIAGIEPTSLWTAIWETSGEYVVVVDRDGVILDCNRVDEGFSRDQVIGGRLRDFTTPDSAIMLQKALADVFATGEQRTVESTVRRHDGNLNYFVLRMGPVRVAGKTVAAIACCENVLSLKQSQQTLEHERHVLKQLLEIQERERQLVSYEIHDGLSQYLTGAMMHLQALEHATSIGGFAAPEHKRDLDESLRLLRAAVDESRRLIGGLRPPALDELGIVEAVESLASDARGFIAKVDFQHRLGAGRLPAPLETTIFRIVQESLSNARKHAMANTVTILLDQPDAAHVSIVVRDDGVGFDPRLVPQDRFGLEGIRQRARLFGSEADITSAPGAGTTIRVTLPLAAAEA